jgi:DNA-binding MarR family transcriptional regulator
MGQRKILEFLEKNPDREFRMSYIAGVLDITIGSCSASFKKLREYDEVDFRQGPIPKKGGARPYLYKYKEDGLESAVFQK